MAEIKFHATPRAPQGTRTVRRLRGDGKIPGVVYGLGGDPIPSRSTGASCAPPSSPSRASTP